MTTAPIPSVGFIFSVLVRAASKIVRRGSIFKFKTWRRAILISWNIKEHLKLLRILSHPQPRVLINKYPELTYKYLRDYISFDISTKNSLSILIGHYSFLQNNFKDDFLDLVCHSPIALWQSCIDGSQFEIALGFPHTIDFEGDLCLLFKKDQECLYRIIFVIANGGPFNISDENVIFISSVQGMHDFDGIKQATKACQDIHPAQLLMSSINGLSMALGFNTVIGIGTKNQISQGEKLHFSYEKFFESYGDFVPAENYFKIQLPYAEKPLNLINANHRRRTQRKRDFKNEIRDQVALAFGQYLVNKPLAASPASRIEAVVAEAELA
ncbi:MAG: DUF535 family protein [Formivibrio sp.]|nr:DUF535 family protein [Formivibrio sp.]